METMMDDSFISTVLPGSGGSSQVVFNGVENFYLPGGDVTCHYSFTGQFIPRRKDWIGIFKVGWKTIRDYYTFMWVPTPSSEELTKQQEILFKAYYLPKDVEDYQFCYMDQDDKVQGTSTPFQFHSESEKDMLIVTTQEKVQEMEQRTEELLRENQELRDNCACLQNLSSRRQAKLKRKQVQMEEKEKEMEQRTEELLRENQELKETCASLRQQKSDAQAQLQREQGKVEETQQRAKELLRGNQDLKDNRATRQHLNPDTPAEQQRKEEKVEKMEQPTEELEELLPENQEPRGSCASLQKLSSCRQAKLKQEQIQEKEKEMEQCSEELLRENQELKETCASLRQQNSDAQTELRREQAALQRKQDELAQQKQDFIVKNQGMSDTLQHQRSKNGQLLHSLSVQ